MTRLGPLQQPAQGLLRWNQSPILDGLAITYLLDRAGDLHDRDGRSCRYVSAGRKRIAGSRLIPYWFLLQQYVKEEVMSKCAQCGNDYDKSFEVKMGGRTMIFDSFECAIQALAPVCPHCGCRIIGHGVEHGDTIFCCVHCAKQEGVKGLRDRD